MWPIARQNEYNIVDTQNLLLKKICTQNQFYVCLYFKKHFKLVKKNYVFFNRSKSKYTKPLNIIIANILE